MGVGDSKPTLKLLQSMKVVIAISSKWYELGIELLDDDQVGKLEAIKADNDEVTRRCSAMLSYWLQTHPDVTWNDLVAGLRAPGVEMNDLAATITGQFTGMYVVINNTHCTILDCSMVVLYIKVWTFLAKNINQKPFLHDSFTGHVQLRLENVFRPAPNPFNHYENLAFIQLRFLHLTS